MLADVTVNWPERSREVALSYFQKLWFAKNIETADRLDLLNLLEEMTSLDVLHETRF